MPQMSVSFRGDELRLPAADRLHPVAALIGSIRPPSDQSEYRSMSSTTINATVFRQQTGSGRKPTPRTLHGTLSGPPCSAAGFHLPTSVVKPP